MKKINYRLMAFILADIILFIISILIKKINYYILYLYLIISIFSIIMIIFCKKKRHDYIIIFIINIIILILCNFSISKQQRDNTCDMIGDGYTFYKAKNGICDSKNCAIMDWDENEEPLFCCCKTK